MKEEIIFSAGHRIVCSDYWVFDYQKKNDEI